MKYLHNGTEFEVAELAKFLELKANTRREGPIYQACSALLARHERVCEALVEAEVICTRMSADRRDGRAPMDRDWTDLDSASIKLRTALRGEEAKRG